MSWPPAATKTNLDQSTDDPKQARSELADLVDKFNELRSHVSAYMQTVLDDADASAARSTLELSLVSQAEAEAGTATTTRAWTAERVHQAIAAAAFTTGDAKLTLKAAADAGWVLADDGTIGSAASGATTRANADTEALYTLLWDNIADAWAPVTGGRGASAAADFAADKPIALTRQLGRALGIAGTGSGLTARALGETLGEEAHTLAQNELPGGGSGTPKLTGSSEGATAGSGTLTVTSFSGSAAHNNMPPTAFWNVMIKL